MLYFHRFEDIRDCLVAIITPPSSATLVQTTLDALKTDVGDYHLDYKRWWQAGHNRSPLPVSAPRYGRAYPRIRIKEVKTVANHQRTVTYGCNFRFPPETIVLLPAQENPPPCGTEGYIYVPFPGETNQGIQGCSRTPFDGAPPDVNPPAPPGSYKVYWRTQYGRGFLDCGTQQYVFTEPAEIRYGSHNVPEDQFNGSGVPPSIVTTLRDEYISDHLIARLNYLSYLDAKILRKGIGAAPDPQPVTEPNWKGAWLPTVSYNLSEIVTDEGKTYFCIRLRAKNVKPKLYPLVWERCNRPKTQVVAGIITASGFNESPGFSGAQIYLFPGRTDIKPFILRPYTNANTVRDWRTRGDRYGLQLTTPSGWGRLGFLASDPGWFIQYVQMINIFDIDLWNGMNNNIASSESTSDVDSDGVLFWTITETHYPVTETLKITLIEEPAP